MQGYRRLSVPFFFVLILGLCPGGGRDAAGRIMDEGRPEPPPRPRIRGTGRAVRQGEGVAALAGSWPGPAAWIRAGNFDRGKRGTGAEARPSRAHRPQAAPRCAGRTGAPGRNGRSRPRLPAGSGQPVASGRFAGLGADLGPVPRWWPWCPAGRIMDEERPEPPPRPRIRGTGRAVRQGEGVAELAGIVAGACRMDQDRGF